MPLGAEDGEGCLLTTVVKALIKTAESQPGLGTIQEPMRDFPWEAEIK